jgi:hypothetical protein
LASLRAFVAVKPGARNHTTIMADARTAAKAKAGNTQSTQRKGRHVRYGGYSVLAPALKRAFNRPDIKPGFAVKARAFLKDF